ncbi:glycosyltransferase [Brachybacterium sp. UNK5269]|uniref:glycosyltransferase n=1 Tax=Brachybacterium sp. UNK5269 TaxID=3408576 RepID=UPI003BB1D69F
MHTLERAGLEDRRYTRRLRSELHLLQPGFRLAVESRRITAGITGTEGEPLRVLHLLTNSLPHTQSGYSLRTHRILTALREQGIESVALTRTGYPVMVGIPMAHDEDVVDGIRYVRTLPSRLPQTQEERLHTEVERALQLVEDFRPHIIHTTTNYLNALVAQAVSDATGLPWVFEVRGLMEQTWVASHRSVLTREVAAASEKHALIAAKEGEQARSADAVVTLSGTMAEQLISRGVDRGAITLVPNGVDESLFQDHIDITEARLRTGLADVPGFGADAFLVGAVSALVEYEGYDILLRAVALLIQDESVPRVLRDRIGVVLAGDGVSRPGLAVLADELGIDRRVHLAGRVPREEARRWIESLNVVVVPRRDVAVARAVTPQKPIEAMALDRPVIASDLGALREVLTDPGGMPRASLIPAGDPQALALEIARLGTTPTALEEHRGAAQAVARARTWPRQVRRYREVYESVICRSEGVGPLVSNTRNAQQLVKALEARGVQTDGLSPVGLRPRLGEYVSQLWERRHFIWMDARHRVLSQNSRNRLGNAWLLLRPLMDAAFYFLIFGLILKVSREGIDNFGAYIIIGVLMFRATATSVTGGPSVLSSGKAMIRAFSFPRAALPISAVLRDGLQMVWAVGAMLVMIAVIPPTSTRPSPGC